MSDIQSLTEEICKLNLNKEMPEVNYNLFKIQLETIPIFDGSEHRINSFIRSCDAITKTYENHDLDIKNIILQTILSKLRDRAEQLICSRNELNKWSLVRQAILDYFGDKRDFAQLVVEFQNLKINFREDPIQFGLRIQESLSKLLTKMTLSDTITDKAVRTTIFTQTALETYLLNLPDAIQIMVKTQNPNSLEQAIGLAQDALNFKSRSDQLKNTRNQRQQFQNNNFNTQKTFQNYKPRWHTNTQQHYTQQNNTQQYYNQRNNTQTYQQQQYAPQNKSPTPYQTLPNIPPARFPGSGRFSGNKQQQPTPMSGVSTIKTNFHTESELMYNEENNLWYAPIYPNAKTSENDQDFSTFSLDELNKLKTLPYIKIKNPELNLLIDTGSNISMISPEIASKYFPNSIYNINVKIKTATGCTNVNQAIKIPCFPEFNCKGDLDFVVYKFHNFYDGIIGVNELKNMNLNINLKNMKLVRNDYFIPMLDHRPELVKIPPRSRILKNIKVNYIDGDVFCPMIKFNEEVRIQSALLRVKNGEAYTEIINVSNQECEIFLSELQIEPIKNFSVLKPQMQETYHLSNLNNLVVTDHLNTEERYEIINLCKQNTIFF